MLGVGDLCLGIVVHHDRGKLMEERVIVHVKIRHHLVGTPLD